jgi:hypothetical protein
MNEQTTEKKTYNNAPLADREYYAKPRWHEVAINEKSGNLCLTVLWDVCDREGHPGNFDPATGAETPLPQGMDGWEAASKTYVIAFADEAKNLAKCKGKDIEYLKDVCPKTYKSMKSILEWCPEWDVKRVMWFTDCRESFYANVVRITVVHEEWNGVMRAKVKWTNSKERKAKEEDTTEVRGKIKSSFGGFFDVAESAPAPRKAPAAAQVPSAPPPAAPAPSRRPCTKNDAWVAFCNSPAFGVAKTDEWFKMVKAFGKKESEFTGDDWAKLKADIDEMPPF